VGQKHRKNKVDVCRPRNREKRNPIAFPNGGRRGGPPKEKKKCTDGLRSTNCKATSQKARSKRLSNIWWDPPTRG